MKKTLEKELVDLADKILHMKNGADVHELKAMTAVLYEKLSVLSFAEKHFEGARPATTKKHVVDALAEGSMGNHRTKNETNGENDENRYAPDGTQYNPEGITEPNTEKIKDIVAQMPPGSEEVDEVMEDLLPKENMDDELRNIGVHYDDLPQFEPVENKPKEEKTENFPKKSPTSNGERSRHDIKNPSGEKRPTWTPENKNARESKPGPPSFEPKKENKNNQAFHKKSLNDRLKKGISFGLNERLVYIKHLFGGNGTDYDRVLSQLNTFHSYDSAKNFIETVVKPDYEYWKGEEQYEKRFMKAIENKLN